MARNPVVESELTRQGFAFEFVKDYQIANIDMREAEENPARLGQKLNVEDVFGYAMDMEAGADWMAIVVRDLGEQLDTLINGRHTIEAMGLCKPVRKTVDCYRVREADPLRVDMLIRTINVHNGRKPDVGERLVHIAEMKRMHPHLTVKELSLRFKVSRPKINEYLATLGAELRADGLGVGHIVAGRHFSSELKRALNTFQNDAVFVHTAQLIAAHPIDLRGEAGLDLIASLRSAGTERQAMKILEARDKELNTAEAERAIKKTRSPTSRATKYLGQVRSTIKKWPGSVEKLYLAGLGTWRQLRREVKMLDEAIGYQEEVRDAMAKLADEMERAEEWSQRRPGKPSSEATSPNR